MNLLEFSAAEATVSRGTYTKDAVCIKPADGNFKADVDAKVEGTVFKTYPAKLSAKMGSAQACADMGTGSTTQLSTHNVRWTVTNGTASYTALPTQQVTVNDNKATVNVADKVTCSLSGKSVPIVVTASAVPFADVKISLITSIADDDKKTDNSVGITPNVGEVVTLKVGETSGVLGFACAAKVTGKELKYKIDGTDKAVFSLSSATVAVTPKAAGEKPATVEMNLAMVADKSEAASVTVAGTCPGLGNSWISLTPYDKKKDPLAAVTDVKTAAGAFSATGADLHKGVQWCS